MPRTSTKQEEILAFLREFSEQHGYAPSIREICQAVGLRSTGSVHYHLAELARQGRIELDAGKKRAIQAPRRGTIPILGTVTAGQPILAAENIEGYLPWEGGEGCFA
ncbi:MAG: transcriptional repressor LexA, partial [Oscillospiraceae bacterium]|nr:transcriptional repressor LexA [Oscillospiraceae bacterium]